jgi:hypothetical protein
VNRILNKGIKTLENNKVTYNINSSIGSNVFNKSNGFTNMIFSRAYHQKYKLRWGRFSDNYPVLSSILGVIVSFLCLLLGVPFIGFIIISISILIHNLTTYITGSETLGMIIFNASLIASILTVTFI